MAGGSAQTVAAGKETGTIGHAAPAIDINIVATAAAEAKEVEQLIIMNYEL
jgi:hypothetical protein